MWHIITPEYPPKIGGVSDYTRIVAGELAKCGDQVHVWYPAKVAEPPPETPGVTLHPSLTGLGPAAFANTGRQLNEYPQPRQLFVQWVPHGYGWRAMNLPFCWWLYQRARQGDVIDLMVHEPFLRFEGQPKQWIIAAVHRVMLVLVLAAARRVWCASPSWETYLRPYAPRRTRFDRLPVPSNVPRGGAELNGTQPYLIGHFSSFGVQTAKLLESTLIVLMARSRTGRVLLIGGRSDVFRTHVLAKHPAWTERLDATGAIQLSDIPKSLRQCQVMVQPILGGVTTRNASVLACLVNSRPVITTSGPMTEPFWSQTGGLVLVPEDRPEKVADEALKLASDPMRQESIARAGLALYNSVFDIRHTIARLRCEHY